ncbi:unnamed protein product [Phytomonas sp. EM1]|nr:unnamed protein product [Phytomonas sp. EM1]|eukprot:CCW62882.1 unnamed protein product [Phytomonas sp. isolate EM1]
MSSEEVSLQVELGEAEDYYAQGDRNKACELLNKIVYSNKTLESDDVDEIRAKEQAIYRLAEILGAMKQGEDLLNLLKSIRPFFALLPKSKTTNMVRKLFERIVHCGVSLEKQHELCLETIQWARVEKRTFLRHRLQLRLAEVLFEQRKPREALSTLMGLLHEVRRLDDRMLLLDIYLLESKINYSIRNASKARAALVSARTTANSIYCPPLAQAEIDLQSGVLHADENDYKTAFSYFYEAFEGFHQLPDRALQARRALRYLILATIATDNPDELASLLSMKNVLEYTGDDIEALRAIAKAYTDRDTHRFNDVLTQQKALSQRAAGPSSGSLPSAFTLLHDEVVRRQLHQMYDTLVERHLLKIVEPYNRVQISYLASILALSEEVVESRLSQLILDKKLLGIVDQQHRCLVVFEDLEKRGDAGMKEFYENAAEEAAMRAQDRTTLHQDALMVIESYDALVTALFDKIAGKFDGLVEENLAKRRAVSAPGSSAAKDGKENKDNKENKESSKNTK